jgi:hypothetical protein
MNYKNWNHRFFCGFIEESISKEEESLEGLLTCSINDFRDANLYTDEERLKIQNYLINSKGIIATSHNRRNAYDFSIESSLSYHTDGEVIFDNLILKYMFYPDFVLPEKWYDLIKRRNFIMPESDFEFESQFDFDEVGFETFDQESSLKKFMKYR